MPDRFDLTYVAPDGSKKRAFVIHRSSIGAIERIIAFLIEKYAGAFPLWLAPVQAKVLPISEKHLAYAKEIFSTLRNAGIRVELDDSNETLGKKIRKGKTEKIPYLLVVGDEEASAKTVAVESRDKGKVGALSHPDLLARLQEEIRSRA